MLTYDAAMLDVVLIIHRELKRHHQAFRRYM